MKLAQIPTGEMVAASPQAPKQAVCPVCGGRVTLRKRRRMGKNDPTYFWRHGRETARNCTARTRPMG